MFYPICNMWPDQVEWVTFQTFWAFYLIYLHLKMLQFSLNCMVNRLLVAKLEAIYCLQNGENQRNWCLFAAVTQNSISIETSIKPSVTVA